jgi:hypothetical protein
VSFTQTDLSPRPGYFIDPNHRAYSPFLKYVSDRESFDTQLNSYISTGYIEEK